MATKTKPQRVLLRESILTGESPLRVDRDRGIIFGVKILGKSSPNRHGMQGATGTDYTASAISQSRKLYEGLKVNADHPDRDAPGKDRSVRDRLGKIINTRIVGGELFGDLQLLSTHPMAETLFEAAEKMPDAFGLSHNAYGRGEIENGRYVIHEIVSVRSVDVVADAGTTRSLFESEEVMSAKKTTLRQLTESLKSKSLKRSLLEMDDAMLDAPMDAPEEGGDWKSHLTNAIGALIQSATPEDHDMAKKILAMLGPDKPKKAAKTEESDEKPDDYGDDKEKKKVEESKRLEYLERKDKCRDLCESQQFTPSPLQLKSLLALDDDAERKALIVDFKASKKSSTAPRSTPAGARPLHESKEVKDGKTFADAVSLRR